MAYSLIPAVVCALLLWWWWCMVRFKRTVENVPTSKVKGVFIGLNEVKGNVETSIPLVTYLAEGPAVWFSWSVEEHWRRTVTSTDGKGKTTTRTESGWKTVDSGGDMQDFYLRDSTGKLLIDPAGAKMEVPTTFEDECRPSDSLYYGKGPDHAVSNSTHRRRFTERALVPEDRIYVLGSAKLRDDVVAPMIAQDRREKYYLISTRSEKQIVRGKGIGSAFVLLLAALVALAIPVVGLCVERHLDVEQVLSLHVDALVITGAAFFAVWGLLYLMMLFNGLIRVRNRLDRALSLIDVQLKRRHDLIPQLVACVKGATAHERDVQEMIARARTAAAGWGGIVKDAGKELRQDRDVVRRVFAIAEAYPDLKTDANFKQLFEQLTDSEDRIELARAFYNDSLLALKNRLQTFPDVLVAKLFRFKPGTYLPAVHDEPEIASVPRVS